MNPYLYKVITKKVTKEDYKADVIFTLILQGVETVALTNDTFSNLIDNKGELTVRQDSIIFKLNKLYKKDKSEIDILDKKVVDDLFKFTNELSDTKVWYGDYARSYVVTDEIVEYFLNDPFYYNKVINFELINLRGHLTSVINFRYKCLQVYSELSDYLKVTKDEEILKDNSKYEHYLGAYYLENNDNIIIEIKKTESLAYFILTVKDKNNLNFKQTSKIYPDTKTDFITISNFGTLVFDDANKVTNLLLEVGAKRQKFIKIR
jgi:hypothetical protein